MKLNRTKQIVAMAAAASILLSTPGSAAFVERIGANNAGPASGQSGAALTVPFWPSVLAPMDWTAAPASLYAAPVALGAPVPLHVTPASAVGLAPISPARPRAVAPVSSKAPLNDALNSFRTAAVRFAASISDAGPMEMKDGAARLMDGASEPAEPSNDPVPAARRSPLGTASPAPLLAGHVAVHKRVAALEALAKLDPGAAVAEIMTILGPNGDRRGEMRIEALKILARLEHPSVIPAARELLSRRPEGTEKLIADLPTMPAMDFYKLLKRDALHFVRRDAARILGERADSAGAERDTNIAVLRAAYGAESTPGVRAMVAWSLKQYDVEPGVSQFDEIQAQVDKKTADDLEALRKQSTEVKAAVPAKPFLKERKSWLWLGALFLSFGLILGPLAPKDATPQQIEQLMARGPKNVLVIPAAPAAPAPETPALNPAVKIEGLSAVQLQRLQLLEAQAQTLIAAKRLKAENQLVEIARQDAQTNQEIREAAPKSAWTSIAINIAIFLGLPVILYFVFRNRIRGAMGGGDALSKAKGAPVGQRHERPDTRFSDVAGIDDQMREIDEIAEYMRDPSKFVRMGGRVPKGVMLEGPPGTGKTLLARAFAGETGANMFTVTGSDFVEMYVGMGASRVRQLFADARKNKPAVIFIDEIDAVGKSRQESGSQGGNDEREQTLNAILTELDGFSPEEGIIVLAATNMVKVLDKALVRPGRFDRSITVSIPDIRGREAILNVHARPLRMHEEVDLGFAASRTSGMSGAELANIINEAALLATRKGRLAVTMAELNEAVDRQMIGPSRDIKIDAAELRSTSVHEAGHVIAQYFTKSGRIPNKVTIVPHGPALGFAEPAPKEDSYSMTEKQLKDELIILLAAKRAEELAYDGDSATGASNDLERATSIARRMVTEWGMGSSLVVDKPMGPMGARTVSEATARENDLEVSKLLDEAWAAAEKILLEHKAAHAALVEALLTRETLHRDEIEDVIRRAEGK
jgi:cell division protease FtsH